MKNLFTKFIKILSISTLCLLTGCLSYATEKKTINNCTVYFDEDTYMYTGDKIEPEIYIEDEDNHQLSDNSDYSFTCKNNTNVGNAKLIIKGRGQYSGTKTVTFTISRLDIKNVTASLEKSTYIYNGKDKKPKINISFNDKKLSSKNYSVSYSNNTSVGKAKAIIEGRQNFKNKLYLYYTIVPCSVKNLSVKKSSNKISITYDKIPSVTGYEILINNNTIRLFKNKNTYSFISTESTNTIKVRAFKTIDKKDYFGTYSKIKTITM